LIASFECPSQPPYLECCDDRLSPRDDLAEPVVTAASFFICWRAMGEAVARHSLRPLFF
jgi:hypothetical protein